MSIQDNRLQFPPTLIDFVNVVGETGQAHDHFPEPGQARYDWMRMVCIGLLANQSSAHPPTQCRVGTLWYNRSSTVDVIQVCVGFDGGNNPIWDSLASVIQVGVDGSGHPITLATQMTAVNTKLLAIQPRLTFSGYSINNNVTQIPVPQTIVTAIGNLASTSPPLLQPLVYINGLLADPRNTTFLGGCPNIITLSGGVHLNVNNHFTVIIEHFDISLAEDVIAS